MGIISGAIAWFIDLTSGLGGVFSDCIGGDYSLDLNDGVVGFVSCHISGSANSGSAGTILFEVGCAERMVSCGVVQVLVAVGESAVMIVVSGRIG